MPKRATSSAVRRAAERIRWDVLSRKEGELLGSEDDLLTRYGVSRPTLRQSASVLVQERLLVVKRGVSGGYFTRRPDTGGVAHAAAVYLLAHLTSMQEIIQAVIPVKMELAVLACRNTDPALRQQLQQLLDQGIPESSDLYRLFLRSERTFGQLLGALSQNKVLTLFLNVLYEFCAHVTPEEDVYRNHPERIRAYWEARDALVRAILQKDEDLAGIYAKRCSMMVAPWIPDNLSRRQMRDVVDKMLKAIPAPA
jgi:GntR family transcriptional repressor for pyruvate dehydrogenase complex